MAYVVEKKHDSVNISSRYGGILRAFQAEIVQQNRLYKLTNSYSLVQWTSDS